jgi:uncharacterized membrane protein YeiB
MFGIWLGRLNWQNKETKINILIVGLIIFLLFEGLRLLVKNGVFMQYWNYIMSDYFPAYIPYIMITTGFALMVISICMFIGDKFSTNRFIGLLVKTGRMTLSHYVIHLTIGMIVLAKLTGKHYTGYLEEELPTSPVYIFTYAIMFFIYSIIFSHLWSKRFKNGPLEMLMRKISD